MDKIMQGIEINRQYIKFNKWWEHNDIYIQ